MAEASRAQSEILRRELAEVERLVDHRLTIRLSEQGQINSEQIAHLRAQMFKHADLLTKERTEAAQSAVLSHLTRHAEELSAATIEHTQVLISSLRRDIDLLRSAMSKEGIAPPVVGPEESRSTSSRSIDDALYVALEDHFRGEQSVIRERQKQYLPRISEVVTKETPLVDFGCGRGEWLDILKEAGVPARGYDSNQVAVAECESKGLDVEVGELLQVLRSLPEHSLGAVTFFQVFEHLPFAILLDVLRCCRRVLKDGGVLIAEVPNSETLLVGASTFWIDPTHERPLHPELLKFLAIQLGFTSVDGTYSTDLSPDINLPGVDDHVAAVLQRIHRTLFGPGDFALIAKA